MTRQRLRTWPGSARFALFGLLLLGAMAVLAPLVAADPNAFDPTYMQALPPAASHLLGTDGFGRSVAVGLWHGATVSLGIGLGAATLAALLGITLAAWAGSIGDDGLVLTPLKLLTYSFCGLLGAYYAFPFQTEAWRLALVAGGGAALLQLLLSLLPLTAGLAMAYGLTRLTPVTWQGRPIRIPLDAALARFADVFDGIPLVLLLISLAALTQPSLVFLAVLIALAGWTRFFRVLRGELLRERERTYAEAARALGVSRVRLMWHHLWPNARGPLTTVFAFQVATGVLVEATLSFLGLGVPLDVVTWGGILRQAPENPAAWWLVLFPGLLMAFVIWALFTLGRHMAHRRHEMAVRGA